MSTKYDDVVSLADYVRELETENARMKAELDALKGDGEKIYSMKEAQDLVAAKVAIISKDVSAIFGNVVDALQDAMAGVEEAGAAIDKHKGK